MSLGIMTSRPTGLWDLLWQVSILLKDSSTYVWVHYMHDASAISWFAEEEQVAMKKLVDLPMWCISPTRILVCDSWFMFRFELLW